ncbi:hypothetical protein JK628_01370 [Shewanella sp. KX20019]|uniref:hypothetical protein n=1 Tax=Shewanella sp. KX20019 TaxID=2803864 RepID=UPI001927038F|nr:hypothetical protein [Shewanella sp. KX20019]QQX80560.1 hypothetical protein JK628_01370 [Shewanella sp. KX20019]
MKLHLNKKKLKNLSKDCAALPRNVTPQVAGGSFECGMYTDNCGDVTGGCLTGWSEFQNKCVESYIC